MHIEMKVAGLSMDPMTEMPILILKNKEESQALPIWIGLIEASAITTELEKIQLNRPMTHDLMKNILEQIGVKVLYVEISDLHETTYIASLVLQHNTRIFEVDSRPSDAIALALRVGCPIRVDERVINKARQIDLRTSLKNTVSSSDSDSISNCLSSIPEEDFGKWKM